MSQHRSEDPGSIHQRLLNRGMTVAVAESLTGGMLSAALTRAPGSSVTFRGGLVVYATDLKAILGGVPQPLLDAQGPVSAEVAAALAGGVRSRLGADIGIGITGVAGPDPVGEHPAGTVFVAVAGADFVDVSRAALAGSRSEIREQGVDAALSLLKAVLDRRSELGIMGRSPGVTP